MSCHAVAYWAGTLDHGSLLLVFYYFAYTSTVAALHFNMEKLLGDKTCPHCEILLMPLSTDVMIYKYLVP